MKKDHLWKELSYKTKKHEITMKLHSVAKAIKDTFGEKKDPAADYWKFEDDEEKKIEFQIF